MITLEIMRIITIIHKIKMKILFKRKNRKRIILAS